MSTLDVLVIGYLIVAGAGFMWYGREAFDLGFYSDRVGSAWIGGVSFMFGITCLILVVAA